MSNLIDKDTLVAEIKKIKDEIGIGLNAYEMGEENGKAEMCDMFLSFIDSLEVKEVDLEKEYKDFVEEDLVYNKLVNGIVGKAIAKHFFEFGLKVRQG